MAKSQTVHSYRVRACSATRSPGPTPPAISPLATPATCSPNSRQVTSRHWPPRCTRIPTSDPCSATLAASRSGIASSGPTSVVAGTLNSRTPGPLLPDRPPSTVARRARYGFRSIYRCCRLRSYPSVAGDAHPGPGSGAAAVSLPPMADQSTQSIVVDAPAADVMAVIADFPAYPQWAASVKSAEVVEEGDDGRARRGPLLLDPAAVRRPDRPPDTSGGNHKEPPAPGDGPLA